MKEMTITQAQLAIHTLRVGERQVTQSMWKQIPDIFPNTSRDLPKPLGFVNFSGVGGYLFNIHGEPRKMALRGKKLPSLRDLETVEIWMLPQYPDTWGGLDWFSKEFKGNVFFISDLNHFKRHALPGWRVCEHGWISCDDSEECRTNVEKFTKRGVRLIPKKVKDQHGYSYDKLFIENSAIQSLKAEIIVSCQDEFDEVSAYVDFLFSNVPQLYIGV